MGMGGAVEPGRAGGGVPRSLHGRVHSDNSHERPFELGNHNNVVTQRISLGPVNVAARTKRHVRRYPR